MECLTIVPHGVEVQTHEVGQEEVIFGEVPSAIANSHGVRVVGGRARGRQIVQRRHDGGSPTLVAGVDSSRVLAGKGGNSRVEHVASHERIDWNARKKRGPKMPSLLENKFGSKYGSWNVGMLEVGGVVVAGFLWQLLVLV